MQLSILDSQRIQVGKALPAHGAAPAPPCASPGLSVPPPGIAWAPGLGTPALPGQFPELPFHGDIPAVPALSCPGTACPAFWETEVFWNGFNYPIAVSKRGHEHALEKEQLLEKAVSDQVSHRRQFG